MNNRTNSKYYIPYFTYKELAYKEIGKIILTEGFCEKLGELRNIFNKSMPVTSGYRSGDYNIKIGGAKNFFHIYDYPHHKVGGSCAVDVVTKGNTTVVT